MLILAWTITDCVSIFPFTSLVAVPVGFMSSAVGIKICTITTGIKKYESIINKEKKKHDKIVLLGKAKVDTFEVLIAKALRRIYSSKQYLQRIWWNEKRNKKSWDFCGIHYINVVDVSRKTY